MDVVLNSFVLWLAKSKPVIRMLQLPRLVVSVFQGFSQPNFV